jgi:ribose transport system substrate-binding protein
MTDCYYRKRKNIFMSRRTKIMKKRVLAVLLGGCMVAGLLAGCGGSSSSSSSDSSSDSAKSDGDSGKGYHFEVVVKSFQSSYWQAAVQGIEQAQDELGVTTNTTGPNAESDIADQVNMLNNAINQNPDGIALAACDQNSVIEALQSAKDKGIPVVCFDSGVPDAPEGSVYATVVTDNGGAGAIAADKIYEAVKDKIAKADGQVRVGEVNQDATSANITERGMGFVNRFIELAKEDGKTCAVVGNDYYVNLVKDNGDAKTADIIIEVAVPAQTTVELCATEASNIMNKNDTIAMFGSNQVSAEGLLTANQNLNVLGSDVEKNIIAAGFDAGSTIKAAVKDGTLIGAVTQSPLMQGKISIETLYDICEGKEVKDVQTDGYWYDSTNMDDADISPNLYD